ncbi:MAG TPA: GGDEF domain-containing protein [Arcobacter sp.]|jgi:diguanylate cyclase (GGDEF)-like protein|nr:GGDEF domain-containing protein [Arcobacter sp.]
MIKLPKLDIDLKLLILPFIAIVAMVTLSLIFSQKIDRLKKEVDLIYFGNFVPIDSLHQIKTKYLKAIDEKKLYDDDKEFILNNWNNYFNQYKTKEEMEKLVLINQQIKSALNTSLVNKLKKSLQHINYLIKHERDSAYIQRQSFLKQYTQMGNYLFYSQIILGSIVFLFTFYLVYLSIKHTNYLKNLSEQYKIEANIDALTSLYNRKCFNGVFDKLIPATKQNQWQSVFVMIDIDFFKQYNDTYGHDAGDIALKKVSSVLDKLLDKQYEYPFRLGGEEFGIIIFNTNKKYVQYTLNNLQHHIKELKIPHIASATGYLTISMGVTMINTKLYNKTPKDIYNLTDEKLYHSKENGRNQYTF